ncbi:acetamidase/formamidase family protein [uncultured Amnibacterium sp.]|uniref:acetamidase/formamidase family protein n=1 Tax=uncultured Amnibacterium sp. TaxID=1631851 RepID=UPI0035CBC95D
MPTFQVPGPVHRLWTTAHEPVLTVGDGDIITFDAVECAAGQLDGFRNGEPVPPLDYDLLYPLVGPVMVDGAEPGDAVELEALEYVPGSWGWTSVLPDFGLLSDDFPDLHVHRWELADGVTVFGGATIPLRPFLGVMGATPDSVEPLSPFPPGHFGGNIDTRDLTVGTSVFLPVSVPGARVMLGDPHAAQGDGEVCGAAIEASLSGAIRVRLHRGRTIPAPQFRTSGPLRPGIEDAGYEATTGVGPDLMAASRDAVRAMIDHLGREYGLDPLDAYVLCSVVVDLKITEVVDQPNWVVAAYLPRSIWR